MKNTSKEKDKKITKSNILLSLSSNKKNKYYKCIYAYCNKFFKEKGNFETHLRAHVCEII